MNTELSSKYDPSAVEATAYQVWLDEKCFHADPARAGEPYSIVIPPPNVTGALHLGHAINATLQDILARVHRMMGFNTLWVPGIDHAGIATQAVVEKQLKEQENKTRHDVGREGLVERIWAWKQQYGDRILEQLKRLGASCDWDRTRFTLDDMCAKAVRETFFKLFKDGLIYRGKRLVNWDTFLQTSISDDEIYHETVKTHLWHIRYPIEGEEWRVGSGESKTGGEWRVESGESDGPENTSILPPTPHSPPPTFMVVATTRPETMLGDTAVAVHSEDPRWNWAIGKHVRLPLTGRLIPIIADDILVDPKFGTGVVKVTPAHDPNDYAVWSRHKGQADEIDILNILTADGKINADRPEWSKYAGMKRTAARTAVVDDLKSAGLLEKEEPYETEVGHSDRSKTPVEPYLSDQWFVKMAPLADPALEVVREGKIKFYPERHAQQYLAWLGEKRDWPVSRQLWWGHRIPVWSKTFPACDHSHARFLYDVRETDSRQRVWEVRTDLRDRIHHVVITTSSCIVGPTDTDTMFVSVAPGNEPVERELEANGFVQDPDVLDTWFSSALWPHSTLGWPEKTPELAKYYPTSVLLTGRDIITLWVARMVMMGMYNMGEGGETRGRGDAGTRGWEEGDKETGGQGDKATGTALTESFSASPCHRVPVSARAAEARALGIPFLDVAINPTILDGKGERMSKSKGNGVDPVDIIDSYGADALRFTLTKMATETQDARMPVKRDANGKNTSEKFDEGRNFCNKLWNACRFALSNLESALTLSHDAPLSASFSQGATIAGGAGASRPETDRDDPTLPAENRSSSTGASETRATESVDPSTWSIADKWIISRFHRAVDESNQALKAYRFDVYAKACYDFFWRDFCDWYVEAIKPAMKDPARAPHTANVLAAVLDGSLRLMHPMIPFITETVWWRLNEVRPVRGLPGLLECPPSKRLVLAQWPTVARVSNPCSDSSANKETGWKPVPLEEAETIFAKLQEVITAIRTIRNDYQVNPKQAVKASIKASPDFAGQIEANRELVELLATCTLQAVGSNIAPVPNAVTAGVAGSEIFVEGLIDPNAEKARLEKDRDAKKKLIDSMKGRLGNEAYIAKAPAKLVQETKDQLAAAEAELAKIEEALKKLE